MFNHNQTADMVFNSINPYSGEILQEYQAFDNAAIEKALIQAEKAFKIWKQTTFQQRSGLMLKVGDLLRNNLEKYATTITLEMGKPIAESRAEIEKCAWVCDYYAENAEEFLKTEYIQTDANASWVNYEPLGAILAIMPWNFPFWQVFRFAAPGIMAGNVGLLKHASNVFGAALHIEEIFTEAGFPEGVFKSLFIGPESVANIIASPVIKAATLTGSEGAGMAVASAAGKHIKKCVLELGGSNAFIVMEDANLDKAAEIGVKARMLNTGQSCIAAKRFIVHEKIVNTYIEKLEQHIGKLKGGNPLGEDTSYGPLAKEKFALTIEEQVRRSTDQGARLVLGGERKKAIYTPTLLLDVKPGMPAFDEELFGPVAPVTTFSQDHEAIKLANQSAFGLGASIFTSDIERGRQLVPQIEDGAVFINALVKSDPRLPFGGTKKSGYGRELSHHGIKEFVNTKTVFIQEF